MDRSNNVAVAFYMRRYAHWDLSVAVICATYTACALDKHLKSVKIMIIFIFQQRSKLRFLKRFRELVVGANQYAKKSLHFGSCRRRVEGNALYSIHELVTVILFQFGWQRGNFRPIDYLGLGVFLFIKKFQIANEKKTINREE